MTTKELENRVGLLFAAREVARAEALKDPRCADAQAQRDELVSKKLARKPFDTSERDALVAEIMAPVNAVGAELTETRRALRTAKIKDRAAELATESTEDLQTKRAQLSKARRELKQEQRAVLAVLAQRENAEKFKELIPQLDKEQREALAAELLKTR